MVFISMVIDISLEIVIGFMLISVMGFTISTVVRCIMNWSEEVISVSI